ncbi:hypothetical protein [Paenibacillus etheri]|uniref:hypothetical protein n=1 Tax=Paenibacillus etheri TaxID=1306852 RepID=UPI001AE0000B|nr:hypothetical protein [Paenibacillus etheri]
MNFLWKILQCMFFTLTVLILFVKITSALQCQKAKKLKSVEAFDHYFYTQYNVKEHYRYGTTA